jgi:arylsulfatase A-like enzyme/Tfp pilus assembly protein PilF
MMVKLRWRSFGRRQVWLAVIGLMGLGCGAYAWQAVLQSRSPNVLLITLDTTRADRLQCYGYSPALTPALDSLAAEGVLFERAYTPVPMTLPSHATMMTGLYPPEHGLVANGRGRLDEHHSVLAEIFRDAGYDTAAFVASFVLHSTFGLQRGFATYDDDLTNSDPTEFGLHRQQDGRQIVDSALAWLQQRRGRRFFCWVHLYDAHEPHVSHADEFGDRFQDHLYDGEIAYVDRQIARLVKYLEANGPRERTVIVVVADHGEGLGDHEEQHHGLTLYNAVVQVPWIWSGPGIARTGRRIVQPVSLVDLRPTLLSSVGLRDPARTSGRSLQAALSGGELETVACYSATDVPMLDLGWSPLQSLTTAEWKYIRSPEVELYDMIADSQETQNVAAAHPDQVRALEDQLATLERNMVQGQPVAVKLSPKEMQKLNSLGYPGGGNSIRQPAARGRVLPDIKRMLPFHNRVEAARRLMSEGDLAEAEMRIREVIDEAPDFMAAQTSLASVLASQKKFAESRELLESVLEHEPDNVQARFQLGSTFVENQQFAEAAAEFRRSLAVDPNAEKSMFELAQVLVKVDRVAEAEQMFHETLEHDPMHVGARVSLANLLLSQKRAAEAEQQYRQALIYAPGSVRAHGRLAILLAQQNRVAEAEQHFQRALELAPNSAHVRLNYATFLIGQARVGEAISQLVEAHLLNPDDPETNRRLQQARSRQQK